MTTQPSKVSRSCALYDSHSHAQAAQAAHARCFKQLKLKRAREGPKSLTKGKAFSDWSCLLKDPVAYMALCKESYRYTMQHTNKRLNWDKDPLVWSPKEVSQHPNFSAKGGEMTSPHTHTGDQAYHEPKLFATDFWT